MAQTPESNKTGEHLTRVDPEGIHKSTGIRPTAILHTTYTLLVPTYYQLHTCLQLAALACDLQPFATCKGYRRQKSIILLIKCVHMER